MTCKVCCNLTHLIDRPHMQTCPRWIEGGRWHIYIYIYVYIYIYTDQVIYTLYISYCVCIVHIVCFFIEIYYMYIKKILITYYIYIDVYTYSSLHLFIITVAALAFRALEAAYALLEAEADVDQAAPPSPRYLKSCRVCYLCCLK